MMSSNGNSFRVTGPLYRDNVNQDLCRQMVPICHNELMTGPAVCASISHEICTWFCRALLCGDRVIGSVWSVYQSSHIIQFLFSGTEETKWLSQYQWSRPGPLFTEETKWLSQYQWSKPGPLFTEETKWLSQYQWSRPGPLFTEETKWLSQYQWSKPGPLFTKRTDVLLQDLVKSQSSEIRIWTFPIALKFGRHLFSRAAEMPVQFQIDTIIITSNFAASRLYEILRSDVRPLSE